MKNLQDKIIFLKKIKFSKNKVIAISLILLAFLGIFSNEIVNITIAKDNPAKFAMQAPEVLVLTVKNETIKTEIDILAKVEATKKADIRPQVNGIIIDVNFEEGGFVKKGQQLYQIDDTMYKADYEKAKASYEALNLKLQRYKEVLSSGAISQQEYNDLEANYQNVAQTLKQAKTNVEYTKVFAPISGYISATRYTQGSLVSANQSEALAQINQTDEIYLSVKHPIQDYSIIREYKNKKIELRDENDNAVKGAKIHIVENIIDSVTNSFLFKIKVVNSAQNFIPGMFFEGTLLLKPYQALTVPIKSAYRDIDGSLYVWIIDQKNTAQKRTIIANKSYKDKWVVEQGLVESDVVILEGVQKIAPGAPVIAVEASK